jgi:hypothetical protein
LPVYEVDVGTDIFGYLSQNTARRDRGRGRCRFRSDRDRACKNQISTQPRKTHLP